MAKTYAEIVYTTCFVSDDNGKKTSLLSFVDILIAVKNFEIHERFSISEVMNIVALLHLNPCSSALKKQSISITYCVKT